MHTREAPRAPLHRVDSTYVSSYMRRNRKSFVPLAGLITGQAPQDVLDALDRLRSAVTDTGGTLRITEMYRTVATSNAAHAKYEAWIDAGKPAPASPAYDAATMKRAYVAVGGRSWHNAARAIDVDLSALAFVGVDRDQWLASLWRVARPLGWLPILSAPDMSKPEAWHFEYHGPWKALRLFSPRSAIRAAILDSGLEEVSVHAERLQAQLWRCGQPVGRLDGHIGPKTRAGLEALGLPPTTTDPSVLHALPSEEPAH